jgi:hypothetical protein
MKLKKQKTKTKKKGEPKSRGQCEEQKQNVQRLLLKQKQTKNYKRQINQPNYNIYVCSGCVGVWVCVGVGVCV